MEQIQQYIQSSLLENKVERADSASPGRRANDLDGKTWLRYSISVWSDIRKSSKEADLGHPAIFPAELAVRLIQMFTNSQQQTVFDPFAGTGSTLVAAKHMGKHGIGIELHHEFVEKARRRCEERELFDSEHNGSSIIYHADARFLSEYVSEGSADLVITSPPYWNILNMKRSADYKDIRNYGDESEDLGKIENYEEFLAALQGIFRQVYNVMRRESYCCVVVMDIRKKNRFYPFHSDVANFMQRIGFVYDDLIIWDRRHEYNNMRPLGYPSVFRVNKAHEFILIFQKPR